MSSHLDASPVTWKNSPVKTFFPEEFKKSTLGHPHDDHRGRSIHLHRDEEIYSMLLSRASSTFFDDDDDHHRAEANASTKIEIHEQYTTRKQHPEEESPTNTNYNCSDIMRDVDDCASQDNYLNPKDASAGNLRAAKSNATMRISQSDASRSDLSIHSAVEYTRNTVVTGTNYEILPYIDFLDSIEREFPSSASSRDSAVDASSSDTLAQAVLRKVSFGC